MSRPSSAWLSIAVGTVTFACRASEAPRASLPETTRRAAVVIPEAPSARPGAPSPAPEPAKAAEPVVVVAEPELLRALESRGFDAGSAFAEGSADSTNSLARSPAYRTVVDTLARDLAADRRADPSAGVGMSEAANPMSVLP